MLPGMGLALHDPIVREFNACFVTWRRETTFCQLPKIAALPGC
jgi:hypothetical protein